MDDPTDTQDRLTPVPPRAEALPPYLVAGNRFGSYGFGAGLSALLLAIAPFGHALAWFLGAAGVALGVTGLVRYAEGRATNRDASVVGLAMGWIGLVILLAEASIALHIPPEAYSYGP